jgi:branched-chain amino acid transport system permease protein
MSRARTPLAVAVVAALSALPFAANSYVLFITNLVLVYAIAALGFDILVGWSGQIGLAHAALFGVGAYGSAIAALRGVPFLLTVPLVGVVSALAALAIGFPALRLTGFFLSIATLAFGLVIVQILTAAGPLTGGGGGLGVPPWRIGALTSGASIYFLTLAIAVVVYVFAWRALRGRFGRTVQAVRSLGWLAGSLGVSPLRYRMVAFAVSGFLAAVAGALYGQLQTFIFPQMFDLNLLVPMLVMVFIGGAGSLWGPCVGAVFTVVLVETLQDFGALQSLAYGLTLMLAIGVLRGGLVSVAAEVRNSRLIGRLTGREVDAA